MQHDAHDLRLSEVIAALSYALDVAEGQAPGHAVRSCLIGMRLADALELPAERRSALFYALLLKDAGSTSNAARVAALYGTDDFRAKDEARLVDHSMSREALRYAVRTAGGPLALVRVLAAGPRAARELTELRCERGADVARMLHLPEEAAAAIQARDEHWDGKGHPLGLAGEEVPLLARIVCLAESVAAFLSRRGRAEALATARQRRGRWFDPQLVDALEGVAGDDDFWAGLGSDDVHARVAELEPPERALVADDERLDRVAETFAHLIDAKSPYTVRHSERVAELAVGAGAALGFRDDDLRELRRAALLHDLGKLGVSNRILDKPGRLNDEERLEVERHPALSEEILGRVERFEGLAELAGAHHERLDGSGYPHGRTAPDLTPAMRVLAVADVFEAMTADRPYRPALETREALRLMHDQAGIGLCPLALAGLQAHLTTRLDVLAPVA